jgi:hypothetical protein
MRLFYWIIYVIALFSTVQNICCQVLTQTIRGKVIDKDSKIPLIGVTLYIEDSDPIIGTVTDIEGDFRFDNLPVGRYDIIVKYIGYESKTIPNILIGAGKEVVLTIELTESVIKLEEVIINGKAHKSETLNRMSSVSARSFTVEETKRYAGSYTDPARMAVSFAGVSPNPDGNNDIVIRGNSPRGLLWRLEGIEIPNPNHFADEGATGGPISILNSTTLDNSDFFTGAFPAEYGNAYSGVFDIKLRKGNNEKREYSVQAGFLGTDCSFEGPFKKNNPSSYLINYRYSTLAILNTIGIKIAGDAVPTFQDLTFNINVPVKSFGTFSVFGIGGTCNINEGEENVLQDEFGTDMGVLGISGIIRIDNETYLKSIFAFTGSRNLWTYEENNNNDVLYYKASENFIYKTAKTSFSIHKKINARNTLKSGLVYSKLYFNLFTDHYEREDEKMITVVDQDGNTGLLQSYVNWKFRLNDRLTFNNGFHMMYFGLNGNYSLEPRFGIKWRLNSKQSVSAGFGLHSKIETLTNYYAINTLDDGTQEQPNKNIDLAKARHYIIGYDNKLTKNLYFKLELYYQDLYDIPVEDDDSSYFSAINYSWGYTSTPLINNGIARNLGMEITLEKFFSNNYYFLITGSLYDSKYVAGDGIERDTRYNGNYVTNILAGKEFKIGKSKTNTLQVSFRGIWAGGRKYTPIDIEQSMEEGYTIRDDSSPYSAQYPNFSRFDFKISLRRNKKKTTRIWEVDIQNLTNRLNVAGDYFNPHSGENGEIETWTQMGFIPILNYRIEF